MHLHYLIDTSSNIDSKNIDAIKKYIQNDIKNYEKAVVSITGYSNLAQTVVIDSSLQSEIRKGLQRIRRDNGNRRLNYAFKTVSNMIHSNNRNIIIAFIGSKLNSDELKDLDLALEELKRKAHIVVVGVDPQIKKSDIKDLATKTDHALIVPVDRLTDLIAKVFVIVTSLSGKNGLFTIWHQINFHA